MVVAFSIGDKSQVVINTLKKSADDIDFYTYINIQEMIRESMLRHISFDRIVFSTKILSKSDPEGDLRELNEFIKNNSNGTEIVMIIQGKKQEGNSIDEVFINMFNSPMYTPIILEKASPASLLQILKDDITALKTRYYTFDIKKVDRAVVSIDKKDDVEEEKKSQESQKKKKGMIKRFFGSGVENSAQNLEEVKNKEEVEDTASNTGEFALNEIKEIVDSDVVSHAENMENSFTEDINSNCNSNINSNFFDNGPISIGGVDFNSGFSSTDNLEDNLSVGDFGKEHSDTGFLDEEDEEDIIREIGKQDSAELDLQECTDEKEEISIQEYSSNNRNVEKKESISESCFKDYTKETVTRRGYPNIDLITGVRGSGSTQSIVDEAVKMSNMQNLRVLIVDLDTKENSILSFIDTDMFYSNGYYDGINKLRVYEEDGVGVISNGFGSNINKSSLVRLLNSNFIKGYDMIFIDCPCDCLYNISKEVIDLCNVLVITKGDRCDLVSTSLALTNRDIVDLYVEKYIMRNCDVEVLENLSSLQEDINWVNRSFLFPNGNWLLNIN